MSASNPCSAAFLVLVFAALAAGDPKGKGRKPTPSPTSPDLPQLPHNKFGNYGVDMAADKLIEYPFMSGFESEGCNWHNVEPENNRFNWTACLNTINIALETDTYMLLFPQTGKAAPVDWLNDVGVDKVTVCMQGRVKNGKCVDQKKGQKVEYFPNYMAPNYFYYWRRYQQALHDFIQALPVEKAQRVSSVQVMLSGGGGGRGLQAEGELGAGDAGRHGGPHAVARHACQVQAHH